VIGSPALAWLIENLMWASAAMLLVLAIRRPVARHLGAGVAYALWLVPALRLIAPPAEWVAQIFATPLPSLPPLLLIAEAGVGAAPPPLGGPGQWVPILLAVWAGGACVFLIVQAVAYRRFLTRLSLSMRSAGTHGGLPLIESEAADGPLALGLLDRRIIVPADFGQRYNAAERQLALDHERYHHRRGDILANHLALAMLALHWFNPIAWAAFRAFRADQELSCDAAIAAAAAPEERCRLCARPCEIREPTRPDRSLPAEPRRPTETETENAEPPQQGPPPPVGGKRRYRILGRHQPAVRHRRPGSADPGRRPGAEPGTDRDHGHEGR
jgi:beta-lactamase regulating signal transducer with metallopeptidase domain